jgi:hypothetical protein
MGERGVKENRQRYPSYLTELSYKMDHVEASLRARKPPIRWGTGTMEPAITSPMPTAVLMAPRVRLKRPVPTRYEQFVHCNDQLVGCPLSREMETYAVSLSSWFCFAGMPNNFHFPFYANNGF